MSRTRARAGAAVAEQRGLALDALTQLIADISCALDTGMQAMPERITATLMRAGSSRPFLDLVNRAPRSDTYARHSLHSDLCGRYSLMSLVWLPGQRSAVHGRHTWCAFALLEGELQESMYEYSIVGN